MAPVFDEDEMLGNFLLLIAQLCLAEMTYILFFVNVLDIF